MDINLKSKKSIISISFILAILAIIEYVVIKPFQIKIDELTHVKRASNDEIQKLSLDLEKLKEDFDTILVERGRPVLLAPVEGSSIIGDQVKFEWKHDTWNNNQEYILEIRKIDESYNGKLDNDHFKRFKVTDLDPEQKMMFFPIEEVFTIKTQSDESLTTHKHAFPGEYLWRIKPGNLAIHRQKEVEILQGEASHLNSFKIYPSVIERIKKTRKLLVGTSPTLLSGFFSFYNIEGSIEGFDIDLIKWIAEELGETTELKADTGLQVKIIDVPFKELLSKLRDYEFDLVISSLTSTQEREKGGLKFTNGYFWTHQILITLKNGKYENREDEFNNVLKEKDIKVGARSGSTNLKAAQYLSYKYGFEICSYQTYPDIYKALKDQDISFGLVDDILVKEELNKKV